MKLTLFFTIGFLLALNLSAQKNEVLRKQVDYPCVVKPKFSKVDEPPVYSGGLVQFKSDLKDSGILDSEITGTWIAIVMINCEGAVAEVQILNGVCHNLDVELLNILTDLQNWLPAKYRNEPVDSKCRLEIVMSKRRIDIEYSLMK